jgi:hypothetical protein
MKVYKVNAGEDMGFFVTAICWASARRFARLCCRIRGVKLRRVKLDRASTARFIQLDLFKPKTPINAAHN